MASLGYMQYKDGKLGYIYEETKDEIAPVGVAPIPEQLEVWDVIFGGGEIAPVGVAPPCTYAEWEKFAAAAAQR